MIEAILAAANVTDLAALSLVAVVAFVMSIIGGLTGFGIGLVLPAFLAPVVGVTAVIPVMAVGMSFANFSRIWVFRRDLNWRVALWVLTTALPGAFAGAWVYAQLSADAIAAALGVFLVIAVPLRRLLLRLRFRLGPPGLSAVGLGFGVVSGGISGSGLILAACLLAAGIEGAALIATDATVSLAINVLKTAVFGKYALLNVELVVIGILIGFCTFPGAFVARYLLRKLSLRAHTWIMEGLIVAGGLSFLWRAVV